jgi:hypothetical protein
MDGIAVSFTRAITGTLPWTRRNGSMPIGYLGREALREKSDMTPERRNNGARRAAITRQ